MLAIMLDKNELQELFVRLKLGTVSVDNAIEEIEKNFYEEGESSGTFPRGCVFEDVVFCGGKNTAFIKSAVETRLEKRIPFICLGLENSVMADLAAAFDGMEIVYDAGMAIKIYDKAPKIDFKAVIITSSPVLCRVCREAETVLKLLGFKCEAVSGVNLARLAVLKNIIKDADAVIVASESATLPDAAGVFFHGPIIFLPLSGGSALNCFYGNLSSAWGVSSVNADNGFSAAMALYRFAFSHKL